MEFEHKGIVFEIDEISEFIIKEASQGLDNYDGPIAGGVIVDWGAHVGGFALQAAKRGAGVVFAWEPDPENFQMLCRNIIANNFWGTVVPIGCGIGAINGRMDFYHTGPNSGQRSLCDGKYPVKVFVQHFDCLNWYFVDYAKIDIEGAEWAIFDCGPYVLQKTFENVKTLEIEAHAMEGRDFEADLQKLSDTLKAIGFNPIWGGDDRCARVWAK